MSLITFGGGPADITTDSAGNAVGGVQLKVYSQLTGGQRITELYDLEGDPLSGTVVSNSSPGESDLGRVSFRASDSYYTLFLDRGYGQRWQVSAATLGEDVAKSIVKSNDALQQSSEALDAARTAAGAVAHIEANVRLFGAVGDGAHDDAPAFRAAINSQPGGARVVIPRGTWLLKQDIQLEEGTWLDAQPGSVIKRGHSGYLMTIGVLASRENATNYPGHSGPSNIRITGGVWDGNGTVFPQKAAIAHLAHTENITIERAEFRDVAASHHIEFNAARNVRVVQCRFLGYVDADEGTLNEAIQLDLAAEGGMWMQPYDGTPCRNVLIEQCYFGPSDTPGSINLARGVGSHATRVGVWHEDIIIRGNTFENCRSFAVRCLSYRNATVENNRIINCAAGINWRSVIVANPLDLSTTTIAGVQTGHSQEAPYGTIKNNVIIGGITGTAKAIEVRGETTGPAQSIDVSGNSISATASTAESIFVYQAADVLVHGNDVRNVKGEGVCFRYVTRGSIIGNALNNILGSVGVRVDSSCELVSVAGNNVATPGVHGIGVYESKNITVTGNNIKTIRGDGSAIIVASNTDGATVTANTGLDLASTMAGVRITSGAKRSRAANNIMPGSSIANGSTGGSTDSDGNVT